MENDTHAPLGTGSRRRACGVLAAAVLACLALAACAGYGLQSREALNLPEDRRDLCIVAVDNPTLRPDLSAQLRNLLRDELAKRGRVRWVDRAKATAVVHLAVESFTSQTTLTGSHDETLKSAATINLSAWIESRPEGKDLWRSRQVSVSRTYTGNNSAEAEDQVLELAAQRLADLMGQAY